MDFFGHWYFKALVAACAVAIAFVLLNGCAASQATSPMTVPVVEQSTQAEERPSQEFVVHPFVCKGERTEEVCRELAETDTRTRLNGMVELGLLTGYTILGQDIRQAKTALVVFTHAWIWIGPPRRP